MDTETTRNAIEITVAAPVLDEADAIRRSLGDLLAQADPARVEVFVLDGGSTDGTQAIVRRLAEAHPHLRLVDNPARLQAAAVNRAAALAAPGSRVLIRADAHAGYPPDFIETLVAALRETGAASVVTPMRAEGRGCFGRAAAAAQNGLVGNGGAAHRGRPASRWVEHGHHAAFDLEAFRRAGGYDERFSHNEDAELDIRLAQAGGRIWLCAEATVTYFPRERPGALARQYYNHGRGRGRTLVKHRRRPALRQAAPPVAVGGAAGGLALAAAVHPAFALVPAAYAAACAAPGVVAAARARSLCPLALGPAAMIMHAAWSAGFARSMVAGAVARAPGRNAADPA